MAIGIGAIIGNAFVSGVVGQIFGLFSSHYSVNAQTLDTFLKTLSSDFANRVENIVRAAFSDQTFLQIKSDVMSAAIALRTYAASGKADRTQLDLATQQILSARSTLFVEAQRIASVSMHTLMANSNPAQKANEILQNIKALDSSMSALQAITALDITILTSRAEIYPGLSKEIVTRCTEDIELAETLKQDYLMKQTIRGLVIKEKDFAKEQPGTGGVSVDFKITYYKDGVEADSRTLVGFYPHGIYEEARRKAEMDLARKCGTDFTFYHKAEDRLSKDPGNINEAIKLWRTVMNYFKTH